MIILLLVFILGGFIGALLMTVILWWWIATGRVEVRQLRDVWPWSRDVL